MTTEPTPQERYYRLKAFARRHAQYAAEFDAQATEIDPHYEGKEEERAEAVAAIRAGAALYRDSAVRFEAMKAAETKRRMRDDLLCDRPLSPLAEALFAICKPSEG